MQSLIALFVSKNPQRLQRQLAEIWKKRFEIKKPLKLYTEVISCDGISTYLIEKCVLGRKRKMRISLKRFPETDEVLNQCRETLIATGCIVTPLGISTAENDRTPISPLVDSPSGNTTYDASEASIISCVWSAKETGRRARGW